MSSFYKKYDVNIDIKNNEISPLIGDETFRNYHFGEYNIKNQNILDKLIRSKIKFNIEPDFANITIIGAPGVPCHIDGWPVALNFYLSGTSKKNTTSFWKTKVGTHSREPMTAPFEMDDLKLVETITINLGECYLLDTHSIHSVVVEDEDRYILRYCWYNKSFDDIKDSIDIIK